MKRHTHNYSCTLPYYVQHWETHSPLRISSLDEKFLQLAYVLLNTLPQNNVSITRISEIWLLRIIFMLSSALRSLSQGNCQKHHQICFAPKPAPQKRENAKKELIPMQSNLCNKLMSMVAQTTLHGKANAYKCKHPPLDWASRLLKKVKVYNCNCGWYT